jgi:hypothetical protein
LFQLPAGNVPWKKLTTECKEKPEQKLDAAFGTTFTISHLASKQKRHIDFSLELSKLKIKKPFAHVKKVRTNLIN